MKKTAFYIAMLAFSAILVELLLFAISLVFPVYPIHNISSAIPDPQLGFRPNPDYPDHDENGFRNENVPERIDLVALGDSQTYGAGVSRSEAWPQQLQELAQMNVYNMAFGSYSPAHGLVLLADALEHKPTHVVQAFYSGNDLYDSSHLAYQLDDLAFLRSADTLVAGRIQRSNEQQSLEEKIEEAFNYKDKNRWVKPLRKIKWFLFNNLRIYRLVAAALAALLRENKGAHHEIGAFDRRLAQAYPQDCLILQNAQASTIFRPKYRGIALDLDDPRIAEGLQFTLRAIAEISNRVQKAGLQFLVVGIPTKELVFELEVERANSSNAPAAPFYDSLIRNEKRVWEQSRKFFVAQQIDFVDSLPYLRKQLDVGKQPFPASIDEHLNKWGHFAVAQCVHEYLVGRSQNSENSLP